MSVFIVDRQPCQKVLTCLSGVSNKNALVWTGRRHHQRYELQHLELERFQFSNFTHRKLLVAQNFASKYTKFEFITETDFSSMCPRNEVDINVRATIHTVQRHRYENSNTWYVNISWYPMDGKLTYAIVFPIWNNNTKLEMYDGTFRMLYKFSLLCHNVRKLIW